MDFTFHRRACGSIAGGALTNSKRAESYVKGVYPTHVKSGNGAFLRAVDGKQYVDFICGLGAILYGYSNHTLALTGKKAEDMGCVLSLGSEEEVFAAEKVKECFPFIERVRFLKTGSEGCIAAVTIARAFTKRKKILSDGYHGWINEFTSLTPPAHGCPPSENIAFLNKSVIDSDVACVIIEPVITDYSENRRAELRALREECTKHGALLVFDETITALRFPGLSVASYFGVTPDISVFGKALGGGSALSCVGGRADVMESEYFVSSTFAGELGPLMKAQRILDMARIHRPVLRLWEFGRTFWNDFNEIFYGHVQFQGYPTRGILTGEDVKKALFMQEACKAGMLFGASPFLMFPHIEIRDQILSVLKDVSLKLKTGKVKLEGDLPKKPQAQKVREDNK